MKTATLITFAPLQWTKAETTDRIRSPFKCSWGRAQQKVDQELRRLGVREAVIQIDCEAHMIRHDGRPRENFRAGPRVALSFALEGQPHHFQSDQYDHFVDNLYAIGMTMEALRSVNRWGVAGSGEQYRGFHALPAGEGGVQFPDERSAARWIAEKAGTSPEMLLADETYYEFARKRLLVAWHPDTGESGGQPENFALLVQAHEVIEAWRKRPREAGA